MLIASLALLGLALLVEGFHMVANDHAHVPHVIAGALTGGVGALFMFVACLAVAFTA